MRCDGLFFKVSPLASDALLTTLHPLLDNVLQTVDHFEISCLGAHFSWLEKLRNRMRRDLDCMANVLMGFHRSTFSKPNTNSELAPCDFWAFPAMKIELQGKKFRSDQRSAVRCREVGGALQEVHRLIGEVLRKETVTAPPHISDSENFAKGPRTRHKTSINNSPATNFV
jgi:hypothetical protein